MRIRTTMMRLAGAGMIAVAVVPWLGGAAASAAVTVYVDAKWDGTDSATSNVSQAGCAYAEVTDISHNSQGWHFVLPGGSGLTSFTANFQTAGKVTVTTTDTASGVIVQGGKGAVVFTDGADVLLNSVDFANHPGQGSAATAGTNDMQLSHLCNDTPTPTETPTPTPSTETPSTPATTPASTPPTTAPASPATSVLPTKASSPSTSVKGVKIPRTLPHTGSGDTLAILVLSTGLILVGGALFLAPSLAVQRSERRH
jgi:hypothetical protein